MTDVHVVPVVGLTFVDGYPEIVYELRERFDELTWQDEPIPVVLIRNPENEHDPNAVQVHVPSLGAMIGHVSARSQRGSHQVSMTT